MLRVIMSVGMLLGLHAGAIEIDGSGDVNGIQALYIFSNYNPSTGVVPDSSGVGTALNLTVDRPDHVALNTSFDPISGRNVTGLKINIPAAIRSLTAPTKITQACGASNAITVDMWVRNLAEEPVNRVQPVRIMSIARKTTAGTAHEGIVMVGQEYDNQGMYTVSIRGAATNVHQSPDNEGTLLFGTQMPPQRIVYTKNNQGVARLWLSNSAGILQNYVEMPNATNLGTFASDPRAGELRLSFGNDPYYMDFPDIVSGRPGPEWKSWMGTIYVVAIYCRGLEPTDLLGDRAPGSTVLPSYPINPNEEITPARRKAQQIYKRMTGINTPIDNPILGRMALHIEAGDSVAAARLVTDMSIPENDVGARMFYNITVRDMATRMSNRDETVNAPLNDMAATIIGVARDNIDARQLLTGNFSYRGNITLAAVPNNEISDFLRSNNHYEALDKGRYDLAKVLTKVDGQKLYNGATGAIVINPDAAGVLTSRAFMSAHASAGTNRRLVEFTFKQFLCIPINQWADVTGSDTYVGRDVDRAPGADHNKFKTTCRSCHSVMDSFRGAFAKVDFSADYLKHGDIMIGLSGNMNNADDVGLMYQDPPGISGKMNRNADTFPRGNPVTDTFWENNANRGLNKDYFGWPEVPSGQTTHRGYGIRSFGTLVSQAQAFPRCMATRAYRAVCKRDPIASEREFINQVATQFAADGYKLRELFARIAASQQCLGQ